MTHRFFDTQKQIYLHCRIVCTMSKRGGTMKAQELMVSCFYKEDGENVQELLYSSFAAFLKRELIKFMPTPAHHVRQT